MMKLFGVALFQRKLLVLLPRKLELKYLIRQLLRTLNRSDYYKVL